MQSLRHDKLANLEFGRTEVDDDSMFQACRTQVAKRLGDVIVNDGLGSLDLQN